MGRKVEPELTFRPIGRGNSAHELIGGTEMRLIPRSRHHDRSKSPRISISQAEITADLLYPASRRRRVDGVALRGRGVNR
jgi:hypothetical protein